VVGIGASASGLDAFKRFLQAMPAHTGMAFVLVPHLDPSHESLMVELLGRHTSIPVCEAQDGMAIEADGINVIPPNRYLAAGNGVVHLSAPQRSPGHETAIDFFLRSLAQAYEERAIGIVLSGTGSHGTLGMQAIKGQGGLTIVLDLDSAEYEQMPRSAISSGLADYIVGRRRPWFSTSPTPAAAAPGSTQLPQRKGSGSWVKSWRCLARAPNTTSVAIARKCSCDGCSGA
jgi:two-component system CheB/CheR fusion protein